MNLAVCRPKKKKGSSLRQNRLDYLEKKKKARRALQGESVAHRRLTGAHMERDRMIWERRNADWAAMYGLKSQL